ncbi:MAG: right-handed parallel beta-helix repeat-containing protein [Mucilaginibacter sp.]|nr:right-handed parallel beta-helix repeat-containing protein [Mucilaginibacter sp.]
MMYTRFLMIVLFLGLNNCSFANANSGKKCSFDIPVSIESILPAGYVKDGSVDYTVELQLAISKFSSLVFPAFPLMVNSNGLLLRSNTRLEFLRGSKIILKPSMNDHYAIFQLRNLSNVQLVNPVIVGDRDKHIGTTGEWGMGIAIYSSADIIITGAKISNCWGDGIYIARSKGLLSSHNISISNSSFNNNRRDGISIISVNGLTLDSIYAANCNGTLPMSGINFEPSGFDDDLLNITATNIKTENNDGNGMQISCRNLYGRSSKAIDIKIKNHTDVGSKVGLKASAKPTRRVSDEVIKGVVLVENPVWRKNPQSPMQVSLYDNNIQIKISTPSVQITNGKQLSKSEMQQLLTAKTSVNTEANYVLDLNKAFSR